MRDAERAYKKAIFWNDQFAEAFANLGSLYAKQQHTSDAIVTIG